MSKSVDLEVQEVDEADLEECLPSRRKAGGLRPGFYGGLAQRVHDAAEGKAFLLSEDWGEEMMKLRAGLYLAWRKAGWVQKYSLHIARTNDGRVVVYKTAR